MKKAILIIIGVVVCCVLLSNASYLSSFLDTVMTGATIPLIIACFLMLARHVVQAQSYKAAFDAVGFKKTTLWSNTVLIFSIVFINTFCLFGGATGVAFIVDSAHRRGADLGTATSGAILTQVGYFAAILVISVVGFVAMMVSGQLNLLVLLGGLLLFGTLAILSSVFIIGYYKPDWLYFVFDKIHKVIDKVLHIVKKSLSPSWGSSTADSFIKNSRILAHNPLGTFISIAYASLSAIINMLCLVAVGFAFGYENVPVLVAAFALAAISVILSPTPQGVGVVEAAIAALITGGGGSLATAAAIALVYRGIMFWIPFCIGAILLSRSDFFTKQSEKKNADEERKAKDVGWMAGTFVGIIGAVNIGLTFLPSLFEPYQALVSWINFGDIFVGPTLVIVGVALLVLAVGLVMRFRTIWAITCTLLILVAGCEFLFYATINVAIAILVLVAWLFWKRDCFDRQIHPAIPESWRS